MSVHKVGVEDCLRWLGAATVGGDTGGYYCVPKFPESRFSRNALGRAISSGWVVSKWWWRSGLRRTFRLTPSGLAALAEYVESYGGVWGGEPLPLLEVPDPEWWRSSTLALGLRVSDIAGPIAGWASLPGGVVLWGEESLDIARRSVERLPRSVRRSIIRGVVNVTKSGEIDPLSVALGPKGLSAVKRVVSERLRLLDQPEKVMLAWERLVSCRPGSRNEWETAVANDVSTPAEAKDYLRDAMGRVPRFSISGPAPRGDRSLVLCASTELSDGSGGLSPWEWMASLLGEDRPEMLSLVLVNPATRGLAGIADIITGLDETRTYVILSDHADVWIVPPLLIARSSTKLVADGIWAQTKHVLESQVLPRGVWCVPGHFLGAPSSSRNRCMVLGDDVYGYLQTTDLRKVKT